MATKKIDTLTDAQRAKMPEYVQEWTGYGLSTEPADRPRAEKAIRLVYECADRAPPKKIVWCGSPLALVRRQGIDDVKAADAVGKGVALSADKPAATGNCIYGQHDAGWLSFYAFMRGELGLVTQTAKLAGLTELCKSAGWALPYENTCYVSERHSAVVRDNSGRLHNLDGAAVLYPDGWGVYAVRGVRVPKGWVVGRKSLDPMLALTHPNVEQRAAAAALIGWDRVLDKLNPEVVNVETSPEYDYGKLLKVDLPAEPGQMFLQVLCATGRTMVLRVPPTMRTAREANAWTNGLPVEDFKPELRT